MEKIRISDLSMVTDAANMSAELNYILRIAACIDTNFRKAFQLKKTSLSRFPSGNIVNLA